MDGVANDALVDADLWNGEQLTVASESVAVMASSNLDTVCAVADTIATEGVAGTSPMDLPNASSNVITSTCGP